MKYACIGERLKHSFSKEIHESIADYKYELKEIERENLDSFMKERDFSAINVTIPYKEAVIPYMYYIDGAAKEIGAINTVVNRGSKLYGYNTDFYGMKMLLCHAKINPSNKKCAVLGTGGTSKTARAVLSSLGAREIITVSRSKKEGTVDYRELYEKHFDTEIIINTTPVGMYPDTLPSPVELDKFKGLSGVIDAVYNPLRTTLIQAAKERGIAAEGGLYMLVAQAVRASEIFLDTKYEDSVLEKVYEKISGEKENVVLIGMPSSGKSTLGRALAVLLGRKFYDSDTLIEERLGMTIGEFFNKRGEEEFRKIESEVIKELSDINSAVIATGGGAVLKKENVLFLKKNGRIVFLERALEELTPTSSRPLSSDTAALKKRYEERLPVYESVKDLKIKVQGTPEELAKTLTERLRK